jgi:hypothetical protein
MEVKYDKIGTGYNSTRQADPYLTSWLFSLLRPQNDKLYLDIDEVRQGLTKLRNDIDNNAFEQIKKQYENDLGDYLFITIDKKGITSLVSG